MLSSKIRYLLNKTKNLKIKKWFLIYNKNKTAQKKATNLTIHKRSIINLRKKLLLSILSSSSLSQLNLYNIMYNKGLEYDIFEPRLYFMKKKILLEKILSILFKNKFELKLRNFFNSKNSSLKFLKIYGLLYKQINSDKDNFYNKQFKEIYAAISTSLYLCKSIFLVHIFSQVVSRARYKYLKKNIYYMLNLIKLLHMYFCPLHLIRINISGKFKGKAKRTQLRYIKTSGLWDVRSFSNNVFDYYVGFISTKTGIFGLKIWVN